MNNYNFLAFPLPEFELFIKDLFESHLKVHIEAFADGADGGIDLRFKDKKGGTVIIQCKQYKTITATINSMSKAASAAVHSIYEKAHLDGRVPPATRRDGFPKKKRPSQRRSKNSLKKGEKCSTIRPGKKPSRWRSTSTSSTSWKFHLLATDPPKCGVAKNVISNSRLRR
jgi:hypothetical protein